MAHRIEPDARFFYLDTEVLFPETYETRDALAEPLRDRVRALRRTSRPGCASAGTRASSGARRTRAAPTARSSRCARALDGVDCWVSGIRRVDSETRAGAPKFGWDERFGLWKLNPLADWADKQVWNYIKEHHVPYNPLHDQGYPVDRLHALHHRSRSRRGRATPAPAAGPATDRTECGING